MRILIIDDNDISRKYWQDFILNISGVVHEYEEACNYDSARLFLDDPFDLVLCDNKLGGDKFGIDLMGDYTGLWPTAMCFLYSQDSEVLNRTAAKKIKCYSIEELKNELTLIFDANLNITPRYAEAGTMHQVANYQGFSQRVCDTLHLQNKEEHVSIKAAQEKYEDKNDIEHGSINKGIEAFKLEIKGHNSKMFWVVVTGVGAQVLTFISIVTFVLTVLSRIKVTG